MKKILVTTAICLIGAASMMAQGRVIFANTSATALRISNPSINGGASSVLGTASTAAFGIGPASVQIQLLAGLDSASMSPILVGTTAPASLSYVTNTASGVASAQGTFAGGNPLLTTFDGSAPVYFQMVLTSINGLYGGVSPIIVLTPTLSPNAAAGMFSATVTPNSWNPSSVFTALPGTIGLLGMSAVAVPEPSSMALAGLGAASLLMFRRRK